MNIRVIKSYKLNNKSVRFYIDKNKIMVSVIDLFSYLDDNSYNFREIDKSIERCFSKSISNSLFLDIESNRVKEIWLESYLALTYARYLSDELEYWCYSVIERLEKEKNLLFSEAKLIIDDAPLRLYSIPDLIKKITSKEDITYSNVNYQVIVDDMPTDGDIRVFHYNGTPVSFFFSDTEAMINVSDIVKILDKSISEWFNLKSTYNLIGSYKERGRIGIAIKHSDSEGETVWMSEALAYHLSKWHSPDFRSWCSAKMQNMIYLTVSEK